MKCIIVPVFLFCMLPLAYSRNVEFYRRDYTYVQELDAFFKVHWDARVSDWNTAFLACDDEGATLFYPKAQDEWVLVKNLTNAMPEVPNVTEIFVGFHDEFKLGEFITVDGQSTTYPLPAEGSLQSDRNNCITMNIDDGKFNVGSCVRSTLSNTPIPFVCKKVDEDSCGTVDHGYKFLKTLKKCYKINKYPKTWQEAMKTCFMEGGILAVIENSVQAEEITKIVKERDTYFVGVRKLLPRGDLYTVKGKKFSDMYQNPYDNDRRQYDNNQIPDERGYLPDEHGQYPDENGVYPEFIPRIIVECGTVRYQNRLYTGTQNCENNLPFICEMEVDV